MLLSLAYAPLILPARRMTSIVSLRIIASRSPVVDQRSTRPERLLFLGLGLVISMITPTLFILVDVVALLSLVLLPLGHTFPLALLALLDVHH